MRTGSSFVAMWLRHDVLYKNLHTFGFEQNASQGESSAQSSNMQALTDIERMRDLLLDVRKKIPTVEFCGVGLILYDDISHLPILSLCQGTGRVRDASLVDGVSNASRLINPCHDGFHLISRDWRLTHTNQYFAPPIPPEIDVGGAYGFGARHASGLLGSFLPSVICVGVLTTRDLLLVFRKGSICLTIDL